MLRTGQPDEGATSRREWQQYYADYVTRRALLSSATRRNAAVITSRDLQLVSTATCVRRRGASRPMLSVLGDKCGCIRRSARGGQRATHGRTLPCPSLRHSNNTALCKPFFFLLSTHSKRECRQVVLYNCNNAMQVLSCFLLGFVAQGG